jgi:Domain of unknown function (DUF4340)
MNKSIKILLAVFAVLIAIYLLFFRTGEKISTDKIDAKLFVADSSKIDKIELSRHDVNIVFEKVNGIWNVTQPINYPADTNSINQMLKDLKNFKIESVTSENPERVNTYLDSVYNAKITTYQEGKPLGTFILGKMQAGDNSYIKKPDENRILLASGLLATNFTKQLRDYRNKHVVSVNAFSVNKIEFKSTDSNNVNFTALKDSANVWRVEGDSVSSSAMDGFMSMFANLNAEDFKDTTMTTFPVPAYSLAFSGPNYQMNLNLYKDPGIDPPAYICQVSGVNQLFKFFSAMASQIMKKRSDLVIPKTIPK